MLDGFRRWLARKGIGHPFPALADWADGHGWELTAKPTGDALIVESSAPGDTWRIEWGPSQRAYFPGFELRLRAPLADADGVQMLVVSRRLLQQLDAEMFRQFTDDLQTRADTATPEEMRWLVLYPQLGSAELGALREHFGATGHPAGAAAQWLGGPFAAALAAAAERWLAPDDGLVIVAQRGRLTLRTPMAQPDPERIEAVLTLFRAAVRAAKPVVERYGRGGTPGRTTASPA